MNLGYRLRQLRKQEKLTMEELADELNKMFPNEDKSNSFGKGTISKWENNRVDPAVSSIAKVAKFFDVTLDYLLGIEDTNTKQSVIEVPVVKTIEDITNINETSNIVSHYYVPKSSKTADKNLIYLPVKQLKDDDKIENVELALVDLNSSVKDGETGLFLIDNNDYPVVRKLKNADDYVILIEQSIDGKETPNLYNSQDVKHVGRVLSYVRYVNNDEIKEV
ncbi:helix-turn-helix domain-containing protein [Staphylococcus shinii]|uniref:helix-turn-helix domain-containing protein n=1 Tax=Staphylococcus shinii TaxID=2912228 RepID=UPI00068DAF45|nr:helix-turn-helix domain-containing protein [Staphylococcus shinii]